MAKLKRKLVMGTMARLYFNKAMARVKIIKAIQVQIKNFEPMVSPNIIERINRLRSIETIV